MEGVNQTSGCPKFDVHVQHHVGNQDNTTAAAHSKTSQTNTSTACPNEAGPSTAVAAMPIPAPAARSSCSSSLSSSASSQGLHLLGAAIMHRKNHLPHHHHYHEQQQAQQTELTTASKNMHPASPSQKQQKTTVSLHDGYLAAGQADNHAKPAWYPQATVMIVKVEGLMPCPATSTAAPAAVQALEALAALTAGMEDCLLQGGGAQLHKVDALGPGHFVVSSVGAAQLQPPGPSGDALDPDPAVDGACRIVDLAIAMIQRCLPALRSQGVPAGVELCIGVHTAPCAAGLVGRHPSRLVLMGPAMEGASGLVGLAGEAAGPGSIRISGSTLQLLDPSRRAAFMPCEFTDPVVKQQVFEWIPPYCGAFQMPCDSREMELPVPYPSCIRPPGISEIQAEIEAIQKLMDPARYADGSRTVSKTPEQTAGPSCLTDSKADGDAKASNVHPDVPTPKLPPTSTPALAPASGSEIQSLGIRSKSESGAAPAPTGASGPGPSCAEDLARAFQHRKSPLTAIQESRPGSSNSSSMGTGSHATAQTHLEPLDAMTAPLVGIHGSRVTLLRDLDRFTLAARIRNVLACSILQDKPQQNQSDTQTVQEGEVGEVVYLRNLPGTAAANRRDRHSHSGQNNDNNNRNNNNAASPESNTNNSNNNSNNNNNRGGQRSIRAAVGRRSRSDNRQHTDAAAAAVAAAATAFQRSLSSSNRTLQHPPSPQIPLLVGQVQGRPAPLYIEDPYINDPPQQGGARRSPGGRRYWRPGHACTLDSQFFKDGLLVCTSTGSLSASDLEMPDGETGAWAGGRQVGAGAGPSVLRVSGSGSDQGEGIVLYGDYDATDEGEILDPFFTNELGPGESADNRPSQVVVRGAGDQLAQSGGQVRASVTPAQAATAAAAARNVQGRSILHDTAMSISSGPLH